MVQINKKIWSETIAIIKVLKLTQWMYIAKLHVKLYWKHTIKIGIECELRVIAFAILSFLSQKPGTASLLHLQSRISKRYWNSSQTQQKDAKTTTEANDLKTQIKRVEYNIITFLWDKIKIRILAFEGTSAYK